MFLLLTGYREFKNISVKRPEIFFNCLYQDFWSPIDQGFWHPLTGGRTDGRADAMDATDGRDGRDGRNGRTGGIQFRITTGTEKYTFAVLLGRRNTVLQ